MKEYKNSNYGMRHYSQVHQDRRKDKIRKCPECKLYFDNGVTYPKHFVYYGAPEESCGCKEEKREI